MLTFAVLHALTQVELFARAGGGGSSSGGGGAGGGAVVILYVIAYMPMHFIGDYLRKRWAKGEYWLVGQIIGWAIAGSITVVLALADLWTLIIGAVALLGMGAGLYGWFPKLRRSKKVNAVLKRSSALDPTWNHQALLDRASEVFMAYQRDWSARDWKAMASYMTPDYHRHATLMVAALLQAQRINQVNDPVIREMAVTSLHDSQNDSEDMVTVGFIAKANDMLFDENTEMPLFVDNNEFIEYWTFQRIDNQWYLSEIKQGTEASWKSQPELQRFARDNDLFYSPDWGWLLIPRQGRLFGRAKFGTSDINNHVIGTYNDTYLLQIYTYDPVPNNGGSYLIAQTNVPKTYGDILVRHKSWKNFLTPRGLTKISMEWGDFNKKYEVFASSSEGATSFELLHPAFMEKLEALPFEVNIEVVDNVVYLYAPLTTEKNPPEYYRAMLGILQEAYKQMRI